MHKNKIPLASKIKMDNITINENERYVFEIPVLNSVGSCFILSVIYVASLYVWNSEHNR